MSIAKTYGVDTARLDSGPFRTAADAQIADAHSLANALGIDGTPTFIVGDTMVPGEDMESVKTAIAKARTGAKAS